MKVLEYKLPLGVPVVCCSRGIRPHPSDLISVKRLEDSRTRISLVKRLATECPYGCSPIPRATGTPTVKGRKPIHLLWSPRRRHIWEPWRVRPNRMANQGISLPTPRRSYLHGRADGNEVGNLKRNEWCKLWILNTSAFPRFARVLAKRVIQVKSRVLVKGG